MQYLALPLRDVTYQSWWRHNARLENTALDDNGEMKQSMFV